MNDSASSSSSCDLLGGPTHGRAIARRLQRAAATAIAALASFAIAAPATSAITDTVTYYHADAAGTPVAATDETGAVLWRQTYLPYGERDYPALDAEQETTAFTGKRVDEHTGLQYFGARDYDPALGRFTSIDPVAFTESSVHSFNRYAYANNNPYRYVDPDGEFPIVLAIWAVGAAISAYDTYQTYQNEGAAAAGKTLAIDMAITAVTGGAGKLATVGLKKAKKYVAKKDPGCCFVAGTPVLTPDGERAIETLQVGDLVLARDVHTGKMAVKRITQLHQRNVGPIFRLVVGNDDDDDQKSETFFVTGEHPFWLPDRDEWVAVEHLQPGQRLSSHDGQLLPISHVAISQRDETTYNITVDGLANYFAGESRVLVHNCGEAARNGPDFVVSRDGAVVPNSPRSARESLESAGFGGRRVSNPSGTETGTLHNVPGMRMDVRVMDGGPNHGPRAVTTREGTSQPVNPATGGNFGNVKKAEQRARSHVPFAQ